MTGPSDDVARTKAQKRRRGQATFLLVLCTLFAGLLLPPLTVGAPPHQDPRPRRVLALHSYHPGFAWTDNVTRGLQSVFAEQAPDIELIHEYMDVKRLYTQTYLAELKELYQLKYADRQVDAIVVSDDHALEFILGAGRDLWPGAPAVFCAVNGYDPARHQSADRPLTGVVETLDIKQTLDIALDLFPTTQQVAVITDRTLTGQTLKASAEQVFDAYTDRVSFVYLEHLTMDLLREQVAALPRDTIVFAFIFAQDQYGRVFSHEHNLGQIAEVSPAPIVSVWEFYLGHGIVGGMLASGQAHGRAAAEMALRILGGENASDIPVVLDSPNRLRFDHAQLDRYGIDSGDLPAGSVVINQPISLYQELKFEIWSLGILVAALLSLVMILYTNILRRKRAEERLRQQKERAQGYLDVARVAFVALDRRGRITLINRRGLELLGYQESELIGKDWFETCIPEGVRDEVKGVYAQIMSGDIGAVEYYENMVLTQKGDERACAWHNGLIRNDRGEIVGTLSSGQDITERRRAEQELAQYREHLEELVEQRTKELYLANERLALRTLELQAKNDELETFTYSVSHDLKAPLRGIDGYSRLLLEDYADQLDEDGRTFVHTIRRATEQMHQLIEDLLTYSRLERHAFTAQTLDLPELVETLLAEFESDVQQNGFTVTLDLSCRRVTADASGLTQALRNLIDNALKFSRARPQPCIEIHAHPVPEGCRIWVKDNGIGFDARYKDRIFGIFERLHRAEDYPGTGIGLAIVRKAMQRMGGRAWAESQPGRGATFYLELPAPTPAKQKDREDTT